MVCFAIMIIRLPSLLQPWLSWTQSNTIATADNNQLKGIIAKKTELDDVDVERNGNTYTMYWISDDDHRIEATLTKNKDVNIVSTDSNHNFD